MTLRPLLRDSRIVELLSLCGTPYHWGKGQPSTPWPAPAYDCSGFAQGALVYLGLLRRTEPDRGAYTLANLSDRVVEVPSLGDLAFYGRPVSHVMVCLGDGFVVGATGGGSQTKGNDPAASVQLRPLRYRSDLTVVGRLGKEYAPPT